MKVVYHFPAGLVALVLVLSTLVSIEIGHRLGRRWVARGHKHGEEEEATSLVKTTVMGLLGLLLAFSFSFSAERYDDRLKINWREANAIDTAYLRSAALTDGARVRVRQLFRQYIEARIEYATTPATDDRLVAIDVESERLQTELWHAAVDEAHRDPKDLTIALLLQSLNEVIDVAAEQRAARRNRVPITILMMLFVSTLFASALVGFSTKLKAVRNLPVWVIFAALVGIVIFTILDLDRPRQGLIRVDVDALLSVRAHMLRNE
ncbi:hypothetical protein AKJ09_08667 [Labilithrix luteola]|uniref:DUF4239 domain-containing protein n=1 Tax=Labilithrix luteola TaxID=1391654 RepID=A0A0K1Q8E8_9BACT|nr:DUF4239 domain-containing protein [Labilithrix luteola]AKV02004.1 hypothetical protein AKJ09_08667 [Labilithrix luteola]